MSPSLTTFLFEAANFLVLAGVLGWIFFKPVRHALAERQARFEADAIQAAEKLAEAEKLQQEMNTSRANLQVELNELRARELESARRQAEQIVDDARKAAERELEMSRRQSAQITNAQRDTLADVSATAAAETVGQLLDKISGPELQAALIVSACRQLEEWSPDTLAPVTIESNQPLAQDQQAALRKVLGSAAATAVFKTSDGLGAGVRISTSNGLIDASVRGLAQFARHSLVKEMSRRANNHNPLQSANDA